MNYNNKDWKEFKSEFNLKNKDISIIIGITEPSIKNQTMASKKLPTWAKAFIYSWKKTTELLTSKNENMK